MWGVKVQPDSESAEKLQAYIFFKCPQLYAHETEDAIQTRREHTNPKTHTASISMSCHRPNRNNTRCTMGRRTKQEESTRIQPWSTHAARVAKEEESNWQTSHGYNPREHGLTSWQMSAEDKCKMNIAARSHYTPKNMQCKLQNKARQMLTQDPWRKIQT